VDAQAPERSRWGFALRLVAVALVLLAIGLGGWWLFRPQWDEQLREYAEFVESERGLEFDHPIGIEWVPVEERLNSDFGHHHEPVKFDPTLEAYALLGLIEPPNDAKSHQEVVDDTAASLAAGYYSPQEQMIYIDEDYPRETLGLLIVHELVHALQDQHGMLDYHVETQDAAATRTALIEGDAERITDAYFNQLSDVEQQVYFDAWDAQEPWVDEPNTFLESSFATSYVVGPSVVYTLLDTEGPDELDRLLRSSFIGSSERLVDPLSPQVDPQTNGFLLFGDYVDGYSDGDIGALNWFRALAPVVGAETAFTAILGYDDDSFGVFEDGGETCAVFVTWFDTELDASEFHEIARSVGFDTELGEDDHAVTAETCAPIGDPTDQRFATLLPIVLSGNLAAAHVADGYSVEVARCASIAQAGRVDVLAPAHDAGDWDIHLAQAEAFLEECVRIDDAST